MTDDIPDPLLERFNELEQEVAARERRERQARCSHEKRIRAVKFSGPAQELCIDCGAWLPA